jgi:hypothetical protein
MQKAQKRANLQNTGPLSDLERMAAIEDIKQLKGRYQRALDGHQWEVFASCLTEDFTVRDDSMGRSTEGRDQVIANIREALGKFSLRKHYMILPEIEITSSTTAKGKWTLTDFEAWYEDEYVKENGEWKVRRTHVHRSEADIQRTKDRAAAAMASKNSADTSNTLIERLRRAYETTPVAPYDPSFYRETISYGHNYDNQATRQTSTFIKGIEGEFNFIKSATDDLKYELLRFVGSGDTVVVVSRMTARLKDGTPFRGDVASFVTIQNGYISGIQVWLDRQQFDVIGKMMSAKK